MIAAVNSLKLLPNLNPAIEAMQKTHDSDHLTPTHTAPGGAPGDYSIKSFFMAKGTVQEQQGYTGETGWGGPKKRYVTVPGYVPINPAGEGAIIRKAMQNDEYIVMSDDDNKGAKFLFVTGTPQPFQGFDFAPGEALPHTVALTVIVIRPAPGSKILSVFAADGDWLGRQNRTKYTIA